GTDRNAKQLFPIDAFVTKLDQSGNVIYSTFLGGNHRDVGLGIAADGANMIYVTGITESSNFPAVNALQGVYLRDANTYYGTNYSGKGDAFVAKINPAGG